MTDAPTSDRPDWFLAVRMGMALGTVVGIVAGVTDALHSVLSGQRSGAFALLLYTVVMAGAFCAWLFAAYGGLVVLASRVTKRAPTRGGRFLALTVLAEPWITFACWVPTSWVVEHWVELSGKARVLVVVVYVFIAAGVFVATLAGVAIATRAVRAERTPRWLYPLAGACAALALGCYAADRFVLPDLYDDFHVGLAGGFVIALACAISLALLRGRAGRRWVGATAAVGMGLTVALIALAASSLKVSEPRTSLLFTKMLRGARSVTDFDRDGASGLFGGGDCAGFDGEIGPRRFDLPEDGRDEDCTGSDARWPAERGPLDYSRPDLSGYNVLVISIDALRARNLGSYGYGRPTSPAMDALAARSLRFARAFSQSTKTFESLPSLFTGLYPTNLPRIYGHRKVRGKQYLFYLGSEAETLAELYRARGYETAGFVQFRSIGRQGLDRGFKTFRATPKMTAAAIQEMKKAKKPFFVWLHYGYPHAPYAPKGKPLFGTGTIDRYDGEIRRADDQVGELTRFLRESKLEEKTIIVITADHGEEFGEHGGRFHAPKLYSELLHVPLIVHVPGIQPRAVDAIAELVDVAPTLCELTRLKPDCAGFDGESLLGLLEGERAKQPHSAYAEIQLPERGLVRRSLYTDRYRLIDDIEKGRLELYELASDPGELSDRSRVLDTVTSSLLEELVRRPFARQAHVFRHYQETRDVERLARDLRNVRHDELLIAALDLIAKSDSRHAPGVKKGLATLEKREGLSPAVQRALKRARR
jgi:arylsulfatase A-like enzyme